MSERKRRRRKPPPLSGSQLQAPDSLSPAEQAERRASLQAAAVERSRRRGRQLLAEGARLLGQRRPGEAVSQLEAAARLLPDDVNVAINLGGAYVMQRRYRNAVQVLERASQLTPDEPMIWVNLAAAYLGRLDIAGPTQQTKAIAAYERALQLDPQAPNVHYNLGLIYKDRQEWRRACAHFYRALEVNAADQDARYWLDKLASLEEDEPGPQREEDDG